MFKFSVLAAFLFCALSGCAQEIGKKQTFGGGYISVDTAEFAVFANDGVAVAIKTGGASIKGAEMKAMSALRLATGCELVPYSVTQKPKSLHAKLDC